MEEGAFECLWRENLKGKNAQLKANANAVHRRDFFFYDHRLKSLLGSFMLKGEINMW